MKIKTTTLAAGPKGVTPSDTEMEVSEEVGRAMIKSGCAVEVGARPKSRKVAAETPDSDEEEGDATRETAALGEEETAATSIGRGHAKKRGR